MGTSTSAKKKTKREKLEIAFFRYRDSRYLEIANDSKEDDIVASALATSSGRTLFAIERQIEKGKRFYIQDLRRGDVIFLCAYHEIYKEGCRRYLYWDKVVVNGKTHLIFLTLISYGKKGIKQSPYWFMDTIGFEFQEGSHKVSRRFVSWTQAIDIQPKHGYIYGVFAEKVAVNDLKALEYSMSHLIIYHQDIIEYLCGLNKKPISFLNENARDAAYGTDDELTAQWADRVCTESGCQLNQDLKDKLSKKESAEFSRYLPIRGKRSRNNNDRAQPPEDLCKYLTGEVAAFKPSVHDVGCSCM
ncbi:hypothetical protein ACHAPU_000505 [Fusarium lateritium]